MNKWIQPQYRLLCSSLTKLSNTNGTVISRRGVNTTGSGSISKTHYDVLGLPQDCSRKEIKLAFVKLSKELHPDRNHNDQSCHVKFVELNEAYAVLVRPESRSRYDFYLADRIRNPTAYETTPNSANAGSRSSQDPSFGTSYDYGFWETRDKSKDRFYEGKPYYGVKGINRLPHWFIVFGCCIFIVVGASAHYFVIRYGNRVSREAQDKKDAFNSKLLSESRRRAVELGNEQQLEQLISRIKNKND